MGEQKVLVILGRAASSFYATLTSRTEFSFPFTRLALSDSSLNDTSLSVRCFFYYQINGSTFAEEIWDEANSIWFSSNITLQTV